MLCASTILERGINEETWIDSTKSGLEDSNEIEDMFHIVRSSVVSSKLIHEAAWIQHSGEILNIQ